MIAHISAKLLSEGNAESIPVCLSGDNRGLPSHSKVPHGMFTTYWAFPLTLNAQSYDSQIIIAEHSCYYELPAMRSHSLHVLGIVIVTL